MPVPCPSHEVAGSEWQAEHDDGQHDQQSQDLAREVTQLLARGLHYTPHYTLALMGRRRHELLDAEAGVYRYDQLVVLRKTLMPAVLLEAGSIINRGEELEMASAERRALTSAAIAAAVEDFCAARFHPSHYLQAKQPRIRIRPHRQAATIPIPLRAELRSGEK